MSGLNAFMAGSALKEENIKIVVSKRFAEDGKPIEWKLKTVTSDIDEQIRKKHTRRVQVTGKKGSGDW